MRLFRWLIIVFVLVEIFFSIFIFRDMIRRIDITLSSHITSVETQKDIIFGNISSNSLYIYQILSTDQQIISSLHDVNTASHVEKEAAVQRFNHNFLEAYYAISSNNLNLIRIYDGRGFLIGRYINGELDSSSLNSNFHILNPNKQERAFVIDSKDIAMTITYKVMYKNELAGYIELGITANAFLSYMETLYNSPYLFVLKKHTHSMAPLEVTGYDFSDYNVLVGSKYETNRKTIEHIIDNISYIFQSNIDKYFLKKINIDDKVYWGVFIPVFDLNNEEIGYIVELIESNYISQVKHVTFFLWCLLTIMLWFFAFIIILIEHNRTSIGYVNTVLEGYRKAIDSGSQIIEFNNKLIVRNVNKRFVEFMGGSADDYISSSLNDISRCCLEPEKFVSSFNVSTEETLFNGVFEFNTKYGKRIVLSVFSTPIMDKDENLVSLLCIMNDLTAEYEAIEELKAIENKKEEFISLLTDYINATGNTLVITKKDFTLEYSNSNQSWDPKDRVIKCYKPYIDKCIKTCEECYIKQVFREKVFLSYEEVDDSAELYKQISFFPIFSKGGDVNFVVCEHKNIFDKIEYERTLVEANKKEKAVVLQLQDMVRARDVAMAEAEYASQAKSMFLANMSHEIRTPINGIMGFLSLLKDCRVDDTAREYLSIINASSESLLGIVNDILDFSKIESGKMDLEYIAFNITYEIESVVDMYMAIAQEKGIDLTVFTDPMLPKMIYGDALKLKQVITNLLSNAIKFTQENGSIHMDVRQLYKEDGYSRIQIYVSDTGIGISKDKKDTIFSPFSQEDTSITRRFGGTGLGLSISRSILELMGTSLNLDTELNKGSTFSFELSLKIIEPAEKYKYVRRKICFIGPYYQSKPAIEYIKLLGHTIISLENTIDNIPKETELVFLDSGKDLAVLKDNLEKLKDKKDILKVVTCLSKQKQEIESFKLADFIVIKPCTLSRINKLFNSIDNNSKENDEASDKEKGDVVLKGDILVVEDNPVNQKLILIFLQKAGFTVTLANNGQEALDIVKTKDFKLIFMDINMPVMDGVTATKELRKMGITLPIIALTANVIKEDIDTYTASGMNAHLAKPINFDKLLELLSSYFNSKDKS